MNTSSKIAVTIASAIGMTLVLPMNAEASSVSDRAVSFAKAQIGDRYVWGATGFNAYDCSGLIWRSYQQAGKSWVRKNAHEMRRTQTNDITASQRRPGDLIFFRYKGTSYYSHVGIYVGSGYMVNAVNGRTYKGVRKGLVVDGYWNKYYVADYRRVK